MTYILSIIIGLLAGTISGLLGVGGGIILIPLLTYGLKMDFKHAVTASLVVIIPTAISGIVSHLRSSPIPDWLPVIIVIVGAIIGAQIGVWLCHVLDVQILKKIFAVLLLCTCIKMFFS